MRCDEVRQELLRCDPAVLSGEGGSPVAGHLRTCGECRAVAEVLLDGQRELARALDEEAADADVDRAVERTLRATDEESGRLWSGWSVPLAAAAVLLIALVGIPPEGDDDRAPRSAADRVDSESSGFAVEAAGDRPVTILETKNPDAILVWFHAEREKSRR